MGTSTGIMKATGVFHIIHGIIMGLLFALPIFAALPAINTIGELLMLAIIVGFPFLYIYIGYELFSLRSTEKMKALLIVSIILSSFEVFYAMAKGETAGILFIIEFVMSIIAMCNLGSYDEYRKKLKK